MTRIRFPAFALIVALCFALVPLLAEGLGPPNVQTDQALLPYVSDPIPVDTRGNLDTIVRIIAPSTGALFRVSIYDHEGLRLPSTGTVGPIGLLGLVWQYPARADPPDQLAPWQLIERRLRYDFGIAPGLLGCLVVESSELVTIYHGTESVASSTYPRQRASPVNTVTIR